MTNEEAIETLRANYPDVCFGQLREAVDMAIKALTAQADSKELSFTHKALDTISRKAAIDAHYEYCNKHPDASFPVWSLKILEDMPSAQPTLHGYNIEHLELIARVLQKENLPPERVVEALTDIGRIVAIVSDEFNETLRKAVEQCMT